MGTKDKALPRVLFVDDNEEFIHLLTQFFRLSQAPFEADYAIAGEGALSLVNKFAFQAVVLDVKLPDVTGDVVAIKIWETHPEMPIALLTNYDIEATHDLAKDSRAVFWPKNVMAADPSRLIRCVTGLLEGRDCYKEGGSAGGGCNEQRDRKQTAGPLTLLPTNYLARIRKHAMAG